MILTTIGDFYISVTYDVFCVTPKENDFKIDVMKILYNRQKLWVI